MGYARINCRAASLVGCSLPEENCKENLTSIWKHRNECIFKGVTPNLLELCGLIITRLALWLKASSPEFHFSVEGFIYNINQIRFCLGYVS